MLFCVEKSLDDKGDTPNIAKDQPHETIHAGVTTDTSTTVVPPKGNDEVICPE